MGIHVRPTGVIIDAMHDASADIRVTAKGIESNLRDHISLLAMGLCKGDTVEITVSGDNEEAVADRIVELFEREFDFPPRR
jgi:phosphotransferase system HPr (HPr) family protein